MSRRELGRAKQEAAAARERLLGSAQALQSRLTPTALASDAWDSARDVSGAAAIKAVRAIAKQPVAASAAAIGIAALIARKPIARLIARLRDHDQ